MKSLTQALITALLVVIVVVLSTSQSFAQEQTSSNFKLLFHGSKSLNETSNWGIASWVIIPNPGSAKVVLGVVGPRYEVKDKWSLEVMAGSFSKDQVGQLVFDIRASYDAFDPIHVWANVEYFPQSGNWYSYLDVNYRLGNLGLVGVETENMHFVGRKDNFGFGPRVVSPFASGQFVVVGAYQFHIDNVDEIWLRTIFNF